MDAADLISVLAVLTVSLMWAAAELRARRLSARLQRAREYRLRWLAWAKTIDVTRYPGWEQAAGTMMRWHDVLDETDAGPASLED